MVFNSPGIIFSSVCDPNLKQDIQLLEKQVAKRATIAHLRVSKSSKYFEKSVNNQEKDTT